MTKINSNRIALLLALVVIITLSAVYGYRLEIGHGGLVFDRSQVGQSEDPD